MFPLSNYTVFRRDRDSANVGGGVCILVRNDISCVSVNSDVILDDCECISCEIRVGSSKTIVGCMYRPPNYDQNHDLNFLFFDQFRKLASAQADQILICGDFNYGEIDWKLHSVPVLIAMPRDFMI